MNPAPRKPIRLLILLGGVASFIVSCQTIPDPEIAEESPDPEPESTVATPAELGTEPKPVAPVAPTKEPKPKIVRKPAGGIANQAERLGAVAKDLGDGVWQVEKASRTLELRESSRNASLNGTVVILHEPFELGKDGFALSESDFENTLRPAIEAPSLKLRSRVVVLDPGHGGAEPGSVNQSLNVLEKDLNLDVSLRLQELLEANGVKVVLTRYNDRLVPLEDRSEIANRSNAGLFISIHFNSARNIEASGIETFALTPAGAVSSNDSQVGEGSGQFPGNAFDAANFELGFRIQSRLVDDLQRIDRGLKRARFKVLKDLECPGALVECGFLSHGKEALLVNTPVYRQKLAESLAESILASLPEEVDKT